MKNHQLDKVRSWVEIDLNALNHNVDQLTTLLQNKNQIMAVVKADAYGHGAYKIARELERHGISFFAVATLDEAITLRHHHIQSDILILGFTAPHLASLIYQYHLTQTVIDYEYGQQLSMTQIPLNIHIKIDSGMHRLGMDYQDITHIKKIFQLPFLHVTGIFSHLCVADSHENDDILFTHQQFQHFNETINALIKQGYDIGDTHIQSSYGLLNYPEYHYDYVRLGIVLYGIYSNDCDKMKYPLDLHPVLSLYSRIACIHQLSAGCTIGYGRSYTLNHDALIATIPLGYADGLPRLLSSQQNVIVHGKKVPIVGRICMDQLMVDITSIPYAQVNDIVTIIGQDHDISIRVEELAMHAQTISNEILSRIGQRLPKVYIRKGKYHESLQTSILSNAEKVF
ncbi:serine racemase VanT catalytic subunit [Candidatus Stoquefichus massiliensis]|uniref:serine racemase VanT catalytic subunit n=1 Tax=Candidatus Stoquefichus massiliensis TaxID=1470350 RepID=UPI000484436D|nr:serine racemase VanT catalytic subunit [Candidatus Stoquefichus massiliensis]